MRILIVTHAPLAPEFGAGQMAINLAEALRDQGDDVTLWSPHPLPSKRWSWQRFQLIWSNLDAFLENQKPFDLIDCPAMLITRRVSQSGVVVARSVQPDILYLAHQLSHPQRLSLIAIAKTLVSYFDSIFRVWLILQGWGRAKYILCLGSLELSWMEQWFPWWRRKLVSYVNALAKTDREVLAQVRLHRQAFSRDSLRFLWVGRWVFHKGTDILTEFIVKWSASHPQDTFTIAGCGSEAEKDCPSDLIQSGNLKIIPSFKRKELYSLLASHDIGLFTSRVEGWGLVLNEMLESGMTVFATNVGGVPDLKPFFQGKLMSFPPQKKIINDSLNDSILIAKYYQFYTWEKVAKIYTKL